MSGKPLRKPGPVSFTQEDIDALARGRRPSTVTRRLKAVRSPAAPAGRRAGKTDNPTPPRLTRGELASLRAGRPSPAVRTRLFKASDAASATADVDDAKPYPSQQPPSGPRKR
jgi:hypothetical protein